MGKWMDGYMQKLGFRRLAVQLGGGPEMLDLQRSLGKMTAWERINLLTDKGTFDELGPLTLDAAKPLDGKERRSPGDGIIMGSARINGRPAMVFATDFTVMSGALGDQAAWKLADLVVIAGQRRVPLIGILDSAGERLGITNGQPGLNGLARLLRNMSLYSGISPRIMMILGPCTGAMAALPALADFCIMNSQSAFWWLGGPIQDEEAGTAGFHAEKSGQCDLVADSDAEAIAKTKELLAYIPQSCWDEPPFVETGDDPERQDPGLLDVMPDDPKFTYDIHEIIEKIVDNGEFFEIRPDWAPHLVTGFCRFGGRVAGIVANNPDEMSGVFEIDSADKYDRFMNFLDAFHIPLITMVDSTAYVPGDKWERLGIIRHGSKNLHSYSHCTCQKITIVLRRAYGGANIVMGCSQMHPDVVWGWPCGEFAPTGPETVVEAVFHKELAEAEKVGKRQEVYDRLIAPIREVMSVLNLSKSWTSYYMIQEAIDPRETRPKIIRTLEATRNKHEDLPEKKRSIKPA